MNFPTTVKNFTLFWSFQQLSKNYIILNFQTTVQYLSNQIYNKFFKLFNLTQYFKDKTEREYYI